MRNIIALIVFFLMCSCNREYCVENTNWDGIENCVYMNDLEEYIKDPSIKQFLSDNSETQYRSEIKLIIDDFIKNEKVDTKRYFICRIDEKNGDSLTVFLKYLDSYVYEMNCSINHNNIDYIMPEGNISDDRFYVINIKTKKIIDKGICQ